MKAEKSLRSMVVVFIVSLILITTSLIAVLQQRENNIIALSYSFILFLTPLLLYTIVLFMKNFKKRNEYLEEGKRAFKFVEPSPAPNLNDVEKPAHVLNEKYIKTEVFFETSSNK